MSRQVTAVPGKVKIPIYISAAFAMVAAIAAMMCLIRMYQKMAD
jgi:hypothetical protein